VAGPYDDAMLHTVFLGFVFAMIFAHAPPIVPAILGRATSPSHPALYGPLWLLHASLLLRVTGDLMGWWSGRQWGGLLNAMAVLLFVITLAWVLRRGRSMRLRRKRFVRDRATVLPRRNAPGMAPRVTPSPPV
jgi:hypothetical protein